MPPATARMAPVANPITTRGARAIQTMVSVVVLHVAYSGNPNRCLVMTLATVGTSMLTGPVPVPVTAASNAITNKTHNTYFAFLFLFLRV